MEDGSKTEGPITVSMCNNCVFMVEKNYQGQGWHHCAKTNQHLVPIVPAIPISVDTPKWCHYLNLPPTKKSQLSKISFDEGEMSFTYERREELSHHELETVFLKAVRDATKFEVDVAMSKCAGIIASIRLPVQEHVKTELATIFMMTNPDLAAEEIIRIVRESFVNAIRPGEKAPSR